MLTLPKSLALISCLICFSTATLAANPNPAAQLDPTPPSADTALTPDQTPPIMMPVEKAVVTTVTTTTQTTVVTPVKKTPAGTPTPTP